MKLVILGPPGSGKGTVSEQLEREFHFLHVSAGELLRNEAAQKTEEGQKINALITVGKLVPPEIIVALVKEKVKSKRKYILDGFPRSVDQAEMIKDLSIDKVLYLDVPDELLVERFTGRRVCKQGHHSYHLKYLPPKKAGICDYDGSPLLQRSDDTPKAIKERLRIFHSETKPVIEYYRKKGLLMKIDGSPLPEIVAQNVKEILQKLDPKL
ncbi:nucleoside monophosphate kinase [Candidatus Woesearchaeota archaeon]|nr:nucleoside monophosphate kinase [Candidatus Woesearchaeota archaeon]